MSIKVVCGCGFCTQLPEQWKGKRVKCKCGRAFIVGETGALAEPPKAAPAEERYPPQQPQPTAPAAAPSPDVAAPVTQNSPAPAAPTAPVILANDQGHAASHAARARHHSSVYGSLVFLGAAIVVAISSVTATYYFTRGVPWSVASTSQQATTNETFPLTSKKEAGAKPEVLKTRSTGGAETPADSGGDASNFGGEDPDSQDTPGPVKSRLANLIDLVAEDGLALTGMFGDEYRQLELAADQQLKIDDEVVQLKQNDEELRTKTISLEQWYANTRKVGDDLLAVLTDPQRQKLKAMIEREKILRVHLVEYSARIRPELAVAEVPWDMRSDSRPLPLIKSCSLGNSTPEGWIRSPVPFGSFAILQRSDQEAAQRAVDVWNLAEDRRSGGCQVPTPSQGDTSLLSRDGRHVALVHRDERGVDSVDVWSTESGERVGSQEVPGGSDESVRYVIRDCVANRIFGLSGEGYWVWNYETDDTREIGFPQSTPAAAAVSAISAGGKYLALSHPHKQAVGSEEVYFVEVCVYRLETGELVGNQVLDKEYRQADIGAMAFSPDGRELALLWDFGPADPARSLVQIKVSNGKIVRMVDKLPARDTGYARQHQLADRDLVWLSGNSGWIVNLQNVVDAETGAILELELPELARATDPGLPDPQRIVDVIPASDSRIMLIIAEEGSDAAIPMKLRTEFIALPKLGPFM